MRAPASGGETLVKILLSPAPMSRRRLTLVIRAMLFLFIVNSLTLALYFFLHHRAVPSPDTSYLAQTTSFLKSWPSLPSFLPWTPGHKVPLHSCEAYFGNGFSRRIDALGGGNGGGGGGWFRCFYSATLASSICEGGRVRMDPSKIRMSNGGESLETVLGRREEEELPKFDNGAFEIEGDGSDGRGTDGGMVNDEFLDGFVPHGGLEFHPMRGLVESIRVAGPGELHCSQGERSINMEYYASFSLHCSCKLKRQQHLAMEIEHVLHMVGGEGENSYANNSRLQEKAIYRTRSTVEEAVRQICTSFLPEKLVVADLGCSSGPNAFLVMSEIIGAVDEHCCLRRPAGHPPEIQFFLNDLPGNDFNNTFRLLMLYRNQVKEGGKISVPFYAVGLPGSFYGRLFPSRSVHFFHSSYCLMWLSQVPKGLEGEEGAELNAGNIYIAEGCSSVVRSLYLAQFQKDFHNFLKLRSEELLLGGRMVLSFLGRRNSPDTGEPSYMWQLLAEALNSMVLEGLVEKATLDAFNLPFYAPLMEEVKLIIEEEGSFELNQAQTFGLNWDPFDDSINDLVINNTTSGANVAKYIRAVVEPLLVPHFEEQIMDVLFSRFAESVATHMLKKTCKYVTFILSLKLKGKSTI